MCRAQWYFIRSLGKITVRIVEFNFLFFISFLPVSTDGSSFTLGWRVDGMWGFGKSWVGVKVNANVRNHVSSRWTWHCYCSGNRRAWLWCNGQWYCTDGEDRQMLKQWEDGNLSQLCLWPFVLTVEKGVKKSLYLELSILCKQHRVIPLSRLFILFKINFQISSFSNYKSNRDFCVSGGDAVPSHCCCPQEATWLTIPAHLLQPHLVEPPFSWRARKTHI